MTPHANALAKAAVFSAFMSEADMEAGANGSQFLASNVFNPAVWHETFRHGVPARKIIIIEET